MREIQAANGANVILLLSLCVLAAAAPGSGTARGGEDSEACDHLSHRAGGGRSPILPHTDVGVDQIGRGATGNANLVDENGMKLTATANSILLTYGPTRATQSCSDGAAGRSRRRPRRIPSVPARTRWP